MESIATESDILKAIQILDAANVPNEERVIYFNTEEDYLAFKALMEEDLWDS